MKNIYVFLFFALFLVGCSNKETENVDILSTAADFNFIHPFDFEEKKTIMLTLEAYEYGQRNEEPIAYFGNVFNGKGQIQFFFFRPTYTMSESNLIESFMIAAIQDDEQIISHKILASSPYQGYLFQAAKEHMITENSDYIIGAFAYLTDEAASSSFPQLEIQERQDFIAAYETYPFTYVIVANVR